MNDLISRQAAINALENTECELLPEAWDELADAIMSVPSAQPERPKGEWIYGEHDIAMCDGYRCNQCGFFVPWDYKYEFIDFIKDYHWCPSCGAGMRGEQDE